MKIVKNHEEKADIEEGKSKEENHPVEQNQQIQRVEHKEGIMISQHGKDKCAINHPVNEGCLSQPANQPSSKGATGCEVQGRLNNKKTGRHRHEQQDNPIDDLEIRQGGIFPQGKELLHSDAYQAATPEKPQGHFFSAGSGIFRIHAVFPENNLLSLSIWIIPKVYSMKKLPFVSILYSLFLSIQYPA
jgi:hypothetical protein